MPGELPCGMPLWARTSVVPAWPRQWQVLPSMASITTNKLQYARQQCPPSPNGGVTDNAAALSCRQRPECMNVRYCSFCVHASLPDQ